MTASDCSHRSDRRARLVFGGSSDGDIRYVLGLGNLENIAVLVRGGRVEVLAADMETERLRAAAARRITVRALSSFRRAGDRGPWPALARFVKASGVRQVLVADCFPYAFGRALKAKGVGVAAVGKSVFPERRKKTREQLRAISRAQSIAVKAMRAAAAVIGESEVARGNLLSWKGKTLGSDELRAEIEQVIFSLGAVAEGTIVSCGTASAHPHEPGSGPLIAGQPVVVDIFPRSRATGFWGDLTRTMVKGKMDRRVRAMFGAVRRARAEALRRMRPGVRVRSLHRAAARVMEEAGFTTSMVPRAEGFIHNLGHGVGLDIHEAPVVGDVPGCLRVGDVVTVEPGLYYRNVGGVRIEDLVVVTRDGCRLLSRCTLFGEIP